MRAEFSKTWRIAWIGLAVVIAAGLALAAQEQAPVIFDMDTVAHKQGEFTNDRGQKVAAGTAELVEGKFGKAVRFTFVQGAHGGFMTAPVHPTPQWNHADGFSFWVKGDGSKHWGGIELIDRDDFALRYAYCFPIDSGEWRKIVVRWSDLTPELAGPLVDARDGYRPSHFGNFFFGKWFYWRDYPAESYAIDQVQIEPKLPTQGPMPPVEPGLKRFLARLRAHLPVTIVTTGDSLSDEHHWSNRPVIWSKVLAAAIKSRYQSDVTLVNPAIGGTTLSQNIVLMPRWLKDAPSPDLVIVWFGFNDWDAGVRGPRFAEYLRLAVDRIREQTRGSADILLLTTDPAFDRWDTMAEFEQAARDVAREKQTALTDIANDVRKTCASREEALKQSYWAWDKTHLGPAGHERVKESILRTIDAPK